VTFVAVGLEDRQNLRGEKVIGPSADTQEEKDDNSKWHIAGSGMF
jgi:hypothetical protein